MQVKEHGKPAWDVLEYAIQESKLSFGEYFALNNLGFNTVNQHLIDYYERNTHPRREMIANLGFKYYETHKQNAKTTLAYTANLCKYLADGNRGQFVKDLLHAFSSKDSYNQLLGTFTGQKGGILFDNYKKENINSLVFSRYHRTMSDLSFKEKFWDDLDQGSDQTHHFVAFMMTGFNIGFAGDNLARAWDPNNPADVLLGYAGVRAGIDVQQGGSFWVDPGSWIMRNL